MNTFRIGSLLAVLLLAVNLSLAAQKPSTPKPASTPDAVVAELYRVHNQKRGPFYQTHSRAQLYKYFDTTLADLIWKDRISAKEEVGALDGDPLYDAQDMDIKNFAIGKSRIEGRKAQIEVTFENLGEKKTLTFMLKSLATGVWKIEDIKYPDGTLRGIFKAQR